MFEESGRGADVLIVGAGLSGLACAHALVQSGHTVQVFEAADGVGGRARSQLYVGEPVDRGFQVVLRGYGETLAFMSEVGIGSSALRAFERSMVVFDGVRWRRIRATPAGFRAAGIDGIGEIRRLVGALARAAMNPGAALVGPEEERTASAYIAAMGLGERARSLAIEPLLAGMVLDRSLGADAGYVRFLLGALARGGALLPVDGIGMIADRAAAAVTGAGGMIWTGVRVGAIDRPDPDAPAHGVILEDGRRVAARSIVVAVDPPGARRLLERHDPASVARLPSSGMGAVTAAFALDVPLYSGRTILVDAAAAEGDDRVDLLCHTTNITRPGSPGPHILLAQSATAGWKSVDPERYAAAVARRVGEWAPSFPWERVARHIDTFVSPWAQFAIPPGVRSDLPGPRTAVSNVVLAGDTVAHPSIEGAVSSGRRAAGVVRGMLG